MEDDTNEAIMVAPEIQSSPRPNFTAMQDLSKKLFMCTTCDYVAKKLISVKKHMAAHGRKLKFECSFCNYSSNREYCVKSHQEKVHLSRQLFADDSHSPKVGAAREVLDSEDRELGAFNSNLQGDLTDGFDTMTKVPQEATDELSLSTSFPMRSSQQRNENPRERKRRHLHPLGLSSISLKKRVNPMKQHLSMKRLLRSKKVNIAAQSRTRIVERPKVTARDRSPSSLAKHNLPSQIQAGFVHPIPASKGKGTNHWNIVEQPGTSDLGEEICIESPTSQGGETNHIEVLEESHDLPPLDLGEPMEIEDSTSDLVILREKGFPEAEVIHEVYVKTELSWNSSESRFKEANDWILKFNILFEFIKEEKTKKRIDSKALRERLALAELECEDLLDSTNVDVEMEETAATTNRKDLKNLQLTIKRNRLDISQARMKTESAKISSRTAERRLRHLQVEANILRMKKEEIRNRESSLQAELREELKKSFEESLESHQLKTEKTLAEMSARSKKIESLKENGDELKKICQSLLDQERLITDSLQMHHDDACQAMEQVRMYQIELNEIEWKQQTAFLFRQDKVNRITLSTEKIGTTKQLYDCLTKIQTAFSF